MGWNSDIRSYLSHWYLRYLMCTELYMVEPWERRTAHGIMLIMFILFFGVNMLLFSTGKYLVSSLLGSSAASPESAVIM